MLRERRCCVLATAYEAVAGSVMVGWLATAREADAGSGLKPTKRARVAVRRHIFSMACLTSVISVFSL